MVVPAIASMLVLVGCVRLDSGAEKVLVTHNPDQVKNAILVDTTCVTFIPGSVFLPRDYMQIRAKNFTYRAGGDVAFVTMTAGGETIEVYATVEAYRRKKEASDLSN